MPLHFFLTDRMYLVKHLILASIIALVWAYLTRDFYQYNTEFAVFWGVNIFPLTTRIIGFVAFYAVYEYAARIFGVSTFWKKILLFSIPFIILHLVVEKIGYDYVGIRNLLTAGYEGLPLCDCLHAPRWMQAGYLLMGPLFFLIAYRLGFNRDEVSKKEVVSVQ